MKYNEIKEFNQRCEEHPDHQSGVISQQMLVERLREEVAELRAFIEHSVVAEAEQAYWFGWNSALEMAAFQISQLRAFPNDTRESFGIFIKQYKKRLH